MPEKASESGVRLRTKFLLAAAAGLALAVGVSRHERHLEAVSPGEYTADQVTVLDAYGATAAQVKAVRRAGRIPICWATPENRKLCAAKGFTYYAAWADSGGN
jgi:hypothetical protein